MTDLSSWLCRLADAVLRAPPARWVLGAPALGDRRSLDAYLEWELRHAGLSWRCFEPYDGLEGKRVLDVGCGLGGKAMYCALNGAAHVTAIDADAVRIETARAFAGRMGIGNITFDVGDAARLPYDAGRFDLVVFNDSFEHVGNPAGALGESCRVLCDGGIACIVFPPYGSPWGAHLFAHIRVPWAQFLFPEATLVALWRRRQAEARVCEVGGCLGRELSATEGSGVRDLLHLNKMTIDEFERLVGATSFQTLLFRLDMVGRRLRLPACLRPFREYIVTRLVAVLRKDGEKGVAPCQ